MTTYSTTFSGQTIGSGPTNFTNRYDAATDVTIENPGLGEQDDRVLELGTGDSGDVFQSFDDVDGDANRDNIEILFKYQNTNDSNRNSIARVRASGSSNANKTCYDAYINDDDFMITRWVSGSGSNLVSSPTEDPTTSPLAKPGDNFTFERANEWHWVRFRVNGTGATVSLKAKWWIDGYDEPDNWTIEVDDTNASRITAAGWNGVGKRLFTGSNYIDALSAGTNGDTAPFITDTSNTLRVTRVGAQTLVSGGQARVTRVEGQVLLSGGDARVTSVYAQVLVPNPSAVVSTTQSIPCIIIT